MVLVFVYHESTMSITYIFKSFVCGHYNYLQAHWTPFVREQLTLKHEEDNTMQLLQSCCHYQNRCRGRLFATRPMHSAVGTLFTGFRYRVGSWQTLFKHRYFNQCTNQRTMCSMLAHAHCVCLYTCVRICNIT